MANQGGEPSSMIRSGDWKLIYYHEDGRTELYDLANDIGEQSDLAADHPEKVAELQKRLNQWLTETGATFPARDPRFTQSAVIARLREARETLMPWLEREASDYLDAKTKPHPTWWGSAQGGMCSP